MIQDLLQRDVCVDLLASIHVLGPEPTLHEGIIPPQGTYPRGVSKRCPLKSESTLSSIVRNEIQ